MRQLLFVLFFVCLYTVSDAQKPFSYNDLSESPIVAQVGFSGGLMNCITDLGGKSNVFKTFKTEGGFYVGAMYQRAIGARLEITWGSITAADRFSKKPGTAQRNLSFSSDISDVSLLVEIHPLHFSPNYNLPFSIYLLGGIGEFSFNPTTKLAGKTILLQPLHTEGEGFPETGTPNYKLSQFMIPLGGGLSYDISNLITLKGELIYRFLNTDYLDDVSGSYIDPSLFDKNLPAATAALAKQLYYRTDEVTSGSAAPTGQRRGNTAKDGYYSLNIKLQFNLGK